MGSSSEFLVCWTRAAKCWWASHHSSFGCSSLPTPFFLAEHSILFTSLFLIVLVLPCLVRSYKAVPSYARSNAKFSHVGSQPCKLHPLKGLFSGGGACALCWNSFAIESDAYGILVVLVKSYQELLTLFNMHQWLKCVDKVWSSNRARDTSSNYHHWFQFPYVTSLLVPYCLVFHPSFSVASFYCGWHSNVPLHS